MPRARIDPSHGRHAGRLPGERSGSVFLEANPTSHPPSIDPAKVEVIFQKFGDQFVMSEVWEGDDSTGIVSTMKDKGERVASNEQPALIAVAAMR